MEVKAMKKKLCAVALVLILTISFAMVSYAADIDDPIGDSIKPIVIQQ
jgi:hypothetical protein